MNSHWHIENTYTNLPEVFYSLQKPTPVAEPKVVCFNPALAKELGLDFLVNDTDAVSTYLSGNAILDNTSPLAQAYAGHQFGHFTMLGDGRAVLLGEILAPSGKRFDIQLKGSGQTPYSRRGDGRATLYSMLREYIISESMHHLGIPTTRGLAVISSGEDVYRGEMHEGGVFTRIAQSHLRVGTFEYARNMASIEDLKALTTYAITRHYPELLVTENPALALLEKVMHQQIELVVEWMRVGFIHGVMNTDNMSIAGETIDYGPCAFLNTYHPKTVFSSIDTQGRYAFGNQRYMAQWNITAFANALLPLFSENQDIAVDMAKGVITDFQEEFSKKWYTMFYKKLGILSPTEKDKELVDQLLSLMEKYGADYTQTFTALELDKNIDSQLFKEEMFETWRTNWKSRIAQDDQAMTIKLMRENNPKVIPRNHWIENALEAGVNGDLSVFNDLLSVLSKPYDDHPEDLQFQKIPEDFDQQYQTFCGT